MENETTTLTMAQINDTLLRNARILWAAPEWRAHFADDAARDEAARDVEAMLSACAANLAQMLA